MSSRDLSRRDFLNTLRAGLLYISGALAAGGVLRYLASGSGEPTQAVFDLGPAGDYPPGSRTMLAQVPAVLLHTSAGFRAISLTCTHLGCSLRESGSGYACACHGSNYDVQGAVAGGPARESLRSLAIEITPEGNLRVIKPA